MHVHGQRARGRQIVVDDVNYYCLPHQSIIESARADARTRSYEVLFYYSRRNARLQIVIMHFLCRLLTSKRG